MTKEQEELQELRRYLWEDIPKGYDLAIKEECDSFAEKLYNDGWRRQVEAEWITDIEYYADDYSECNTRKVFTCSRCGRFEKYEQPYCNCGAKMRKRK